MIIGYIGLGLLLSGYVASYKDKLKWFYLLSSIASIFLAIHAYILRDPVFLIVNVIVFIMMDIKWRQTK